MNAQEKLERLRRSLRATGGLAVAYSGGVDSTFLAAVAQQELGPRLVAVTALSPTYPEREQREAAELAAELGICHETVVSDELAIPGFAGNPPDRCYACKRELFRAVSEVARRHGIFRVADGANADDEKDYRPGRKAAREAGVLSPLLEAGLGKAEIRELSASLGLPTASKPAFACLASRFPYGAPITAGGLRAVDLFEEGLRKLGIGQLRVRHHGDVARIEVEGGAIERLARPGVRELVVRLGREAGFAYVALDLVGYRQGSMNEVLPQRKLETRPEIDESESTKHPR